MRSYRSKRSGNAKLKKILLRILFVIVAAIVITVLAILLGNHLLEKVNSLDNEVNDPASETEETAPDPSNEYVITSTEAPSVSAAAIDVRKFETQDELVEKITELSAHYDTLIIKLCSEDGGLIYPSPAICKLLGIPHTNENTVLELVISAVSAASVRNMRLCALIPSSLGNSASASASVIDGALIKELLEYGFDEIMIQYPAIDTDGFSHNSAARLSGYIKECKENSQTSCHIGIILPAELYLDAAFAKHIQIIASTVSFMGIDFSTECMTTSSEIFSSVSHDITSLLGSFNTYNMRHIISSDDIVVMAAEHTACRQNNMTNVCIMEPLLPDELKYDRNATVQPEAPETLAPEEVTETNPYASTADKYPDAPPSTTDDGADETKPAETEKPWY
ncbi:MAG: hypothetical protein E7627_08805 [Ruminococcaceae bacterium]|nr:hypothetical protein [Oscillospiraceae bacterium]